MSAAPEAEERRFNNISGWAIRHPVQTLVLFLLLTVAGIASYPFLRINVNPDIDLPAVVVTVAQPGAAPSELETQVTRRVEDAVSGLGDVRHITSTVTDGASTTAVEFALGKDIDQAVSDIRDRLSRIRSDLPADIREPQVTRVEITGAPIGTYTVRVPGLSPVETSWYVDDTVAKALLAIPGVAQVNRVGGADREVRVALDPDRLAALGITAAEVNAQLRDLNVDRPGGRGTLGAGEQAVRTLGSAPSLEALRERPIILPGGRTARLSDLGTVTDATAEIRTAARLNDAPVVAFEVMRTRGSSEVAVSERVAATVAKLAAARPGTEIARVASTTEFVIEGYHGAIEALLIGAGLATLVVWVFLRNLRATLISAIAMPLSLVPTFAAMYALGYSLNNVTLLGITLVVGVLVDDAIVEIENIVRHLRTGRGPDGQRLTPRRAALEASAEIGMAVVATTACILAVFVPVAFMPGIPGQFFRQFGLTVAAAVAFSLVVARLLTPLMGAYLLRPKDAEGHQDSEGRVMRGYLRLLRWSLRHRWVTLAGGVLFFAGSVALVPMIPQDFVPAPDMNRSTLNLELAPGARLAETEAAVSQATAILRARPEVTSVFAAIGTFQADGGMPVSGSQAGDPRNATLIVNLVPRGRRALTQTQFETDVRPALAAIPGVRLRFGAAGESGTKITTTLVGEDPEALIATARRLESEMRALPQFPGARSTASLARPELQIVPRSERAAELGVSVAAIANTARVATLGDIDAQLAKYSLPDRQVPIRVMLTEGARDDLAVLRTLRVTGSNGRSVPLDAVAEIRLGSGPTQIDRLDRARKVTVEAELSGMPLGEASALVAGLPVMQALPPGVHEKAVGDAEIMAELFQGFVMALGAGVLLVYLVLVVLFGGFLQPLTIMTALPLSLGGALVALLLAQQALGVSSVIGVLMLMGIVAKNSILLVEYAIESQRAGLPVREALLEAARKRARPIVMTTIAMTAGMAHIALGLGADAEFRSPMAVTVIGGLITSTLLSLVFVPAAYTLMDDVGRGVAWVARGRRGRAAKAPAARAVPAE
ncbi:efflux RND transporter permease subunit [Roseomonas sp. OT10]|uniref:efflux RND transporter permease subunit n=1 Tax=Roseomonas cutis TaxID=2897332 RepID=UPI001E456517|nr:efflux RND transporter permease subunit [Roseomonas sp. OT10]UFN49951.1 efflux RND transporter permease subunit [Roseomonas sp. OT10]